MQLIETEPLYEVVNGERREVSPMGIFSGSLASVLSQYLGLFVMQQKLGVVVIEVLFRLKADAPARRPDIAYVSFDRMPSWEVPADDPPEWNVVPNLAVEVVSPNNTAEEIEIKVLEYFAADVELVWVIYPRQRRIHVYESPTQNRILQEADDLDGAPVLPGFRVKVADLFAALARTKD